MEIKLASILIIILGSLMSLKKELTMERESVFGKYKTRSRYSHMTLTLFTDSTYSLNRGGCLSSCSDAGKFSIDRHILTFISINKFSSDELIIGHNKVCNLNTSPFIIKRGRIYYTVPGNKEYFYLEKVKK